MVGVFLLSAFICVIARVLNFTLALFINVRHVFARELLPAAIQFSVHAMTDWPDMKGSGKRKRRRERENIIDDVCYVEERKGGGRPSAHQ